MERLIGWLTAWGKPEPPTVRDHQHADQGGHVDMSGIPGAISDEKMKQLKARRGGAFQAMWLRVMISHHQGALELSGSEINDGHYRPLVRQARAIGRTQMVELTRLKSLLSASGD